MITGWDPYENIPTTTQKGIDLLLKKPNISNRSFYTLPTLLLTPLSLRMTSLTIRRRQERMAI